MPAISHGPEPAVEPPRRVLAIVPRLPLAPRRRAMWMQASRRCRRSWRLRDDAVTGEVSRSRSATRVPHGPAHERPSRRRPPRPRPRPILFLLIPDFSMIAFTSAIEPLRIANRLSGQRLYDWRLVSRDGGPVAASNGIAIQVDAAIAAHEPTGDRRAAGDRRSAAAWARSTTRTRRCSPGCAAGTGAAPRSAPCAPAPTCWPAPACSTATAARSTGRTCRASSRPSPRSRSPPTCTRSTATASPARAAPRRST